MEGYDFTIDHGVAREGSEGMCNRRISRGEVVIIPRVKLDVPPVFIARAR